MSVAKRKKQQNEMCEVRINTVSTQCAQNTTLCSEVDQLNEQSMLKVKLLIRDGRLGKEMCAIIEVLMLNGCRVSEAINIRFQDIISENTIRLRGLKGSSDRIIYISENSGYIDYCKKHQINPFMHISRFQVYRVLKRNGLQEIFGDNKKFSTTHLFRHLFVKSMLEKGIKIEEIQRIIGHKKLENTLIYAK